MKKGSRKYIKILRKKKMKKVVNIIKNVKRSYLAKKKLFSTYQITI